MKSFMITTGAVFISQALTVNQTLQELSMSWNNVGDDGIMAIAKSLCKSCITILDIRGCGITDNGVRSLARALLTNQNIKKLSLWGNPFTVDGARLITKNAVANGVCQHVAINSEYWNDDKVKKMMDILQMRSKNNYVVLM